MNDFVKEILTFGAHGRVKSKELDLKDEQRRVEELNARLEGKIGEANAKIEVLVASKVEAINALKQLSRITKNVRSKERIIAGESVSEHALNKDHLSVVADTIDAFDIASNITKGAISGASTAMGAWALAGTLGTASTGTAISTLSGAAATNATLAWLGGGSLAAGGGGIAAGTMVVGGLVAVPALVLTGVFSHVSANKKIKKIEVEIDKLVKCMDEAEINITFVSLIKERAEELASAIDRTTEVFLAELGKTEKEFYPYGKLSLFFRWLRSKFGFGYLSKKDSEKVSYIGGLAVNLAKMVDTKVLNDDGTLA